MEFTKENINILAKKLRCLEKDLENCCGNSAGPLVYRALMSQSGSDAPIVVVLENTIGDIVWSRSGVGNYEGTLLNAFTLDGCVTFINSPTNASNTNIIGFSTISEISVKSRLANGSPSDDLLNNVGGKGVTNYTSICILQYN